MQGSPLAALAMGLLREGVDSAGIDPAIVEIEECANGDGEINGLVVPALCVQWLHVASRNIGRIVIDFINKAQQRFIFIIQPTCLQIVENALDQFFAAQ